MLTLQHWPGLVAGVALLLLAAWAMALSPGNKLHRSFALFLLLRASMIGLGRFTYDRDHFGHFAGALVPYFQIAEPFAIANFAVLFAATYGPLQDDAARRRRSWLRWALLASSAAVESWYFLDHAAYVPASGPDGPLYVAFPLGIATAAWAGFLVGREGLRSRTGCDPHAFFLFALAFVAEPLYYALGLAPWNVPTDATEWQWSILLWSTFAAAAGLVGVALWHRLRVGPTPVRRQAKITLAFLAVVALSSQVPDWVNAFLGVPEMTLSSPGETVHLFLNAFWLIVLVALAAYAILRYKILTIDVRLKFIFRESVTAAVLTGLFFVVEGTLQWIIQGALPPFGAADLLVNLVAAGVVAAGLVPVHRAGTRLANHLIPIRDGPPYRSARALKIYRAAYEQAHRDGNVSHRERTALQRLAATLSISSAQAAAIETI